MKFSIHVVGEPDWPVERPEYYCGWPVYNVAFMCPFCLTDWAMIRMEGPARQYHIEPASCASCPPAHERMNPVPGSILDNSVFSNGPDLDLLEALPEALLRREFDLHIRQFDKEQANVKPATDLYPATGRASVSPSNRLSTAR